MNSATTFKLFRRAIRGDFEGGEVEIDRDAWGKILKLSKKHDLAHLIGCVIKKQPKTVIDTDLAKAFMQEVDLAKFRYVKIDYDLKSISRALEDAKIRFLPLKGSVIRKYYREPWLRTSCDIDVLIHPEDVDKVKDLFIDELKFTYESSWNYQLSFYTPAKTHIELHHTLSDGAGKVDQVLSEVWKRSLLEDGYAYRYKMSDEMYYTYHIAHMAKHFTSGGCGIRPFIDVWVLNHECEFDADKRYELLEEAGLLPFAKAAERLSKAWFGEAEHDTLTEQLEEFILSGGTYGTAENRVAVQQAVQGNKLRYILSRIFLPYDQLKLTYPSLDRRRWLMPIYQVRRWFRLLKKGRLRRSLQEAKTTSEITSEKQDQTTRLLEELGIN